MTPRRPPQTALVFALALTLALAVRCHDSDTITGPPATPTPSPTSSPTPTATGGDITGAWNGTETASASGCPTVAASATFTQSGTAIAGTLNAESICGFTNLQVSGTFDGTNVRATAEKGVGVTGTVSGNNMTLHITGLDIDAAFADMSLHRP